MQGVSSQGFIRKFTSAIHGAIYGDGMQVCFVTMMPPATSRMHLYSSFILLCEARAWLIKLPNLGLNVAYTDKNIHHYSLNPGFISVSVIAFLSKTVAF